MSDTISIGREGWLGVGVESSPGSRQDPEKYIPFNSCDLHPVVEVVDDESAKGIREATWGSKTTQEQGEGDIEINLDVAHSPYFLYPALGSISSTTASGESSVYEHTITRKASNPPTTLTLNYNNTAATEEYQNAVVNTCELSFSDEFATLSSGVIAKSPTSGTGSKSITEETILAFSDANIYFGSDFATAWDNYSNDTNSKSLSEFTVEINNNAEAHFQSGSTDPSDISMGELEVSGDYTLFFETETEKNAFKNQTQRAMVVSLKGSSIGSGETEEVLIKIPQFHLTDRGIDTSPDSFATENPSFVADYYSTTTQSFPGSIEVKITNEKSSY